MIFLSTFLHERGEDKEAADWLHKAIESGDAKVIASARKTLRSFNL